MDIISAKELNLNLSSSTDLKKISQFVISEYFILNTSRNTEISYIERGAERLFQVAQDRSVSMLYCDRLHNNEIKKSIDYHIGSVRDDFDFGSLWVIKSTLFLDYLQILPEYQYAALYALRLFLSRKGEIFHLPEILYHEKETLFHDNQEEHFSYVNPNNREVQIEMEDVFTDHLKKINAWLPPKQSTHKKQFIIPNNNFTIASIIIPVKNRVHTILDAVNSALSQQCSFSYNVIVVDNHSDDGTTEKLQSLSNTPRLIHLIPQDKHLGIGGCWNYAIHSSFCGYYSVQLDSDDVYSSNDTLQQIVDKFRTTDASMVVGSYRIVNFKYQELPPGLIQHKEWSDKNGLNNILRINGLGAPRAFKTDVIKKINFPNTSYGEDYAMGLRISRDFIIERIYDELYLCRRWDGNSDSKLNQDTANLYNQYKDQLRSTEIIARKNRFQKPGFEIQDKIHNLLLRQLVTWDFMAENYERLHSSSLSKELTHKDYSLTIQYNKGRISSTTSDISPESIRSRKCFLCKEHRPLIQESIVVDDIEILVNPFPILPEHFTIVFTTHIQQSFKLFSKYLSYLVHTCPKWIFFYNGPKCGASAPDHAHIQAGSRNVVPLEKNWNQYYKQLKLIKTEDKSNKYGTFYLLDYYCPCLVTIARSSEESHYLNSQVINTLQSYNSEPININILSWLWLCKKYENSTHVTIIFLRKKHRPDCYYLKNKDRLVISPGTLDMAGLIITPDKKTYETIDFTIAKDIIKEVSISEDIFLDYIHQLSNDL